MAKERQCSWIKDIDFELYDSYYDENDSVIEAENDEIYVAESAYDADNVVVFHDVDIEYDSNEEEEWTDKTLSYGSDCGYLC